ncbi:hypothetical protein BHU72_02625 [Desulfuribacillus stibiiarsenatis]|uniref:DUF2229 domain-containing protein n=1 Tax=Desulfuribacillus stibiiarsenatis TaxID=1390249 RepID=A0A1E5L6C0_9FIRM|nr:acyl-CoA dehydratase activase-related protein [Desulfuribacillus stibiiarsenatis]OEH85707.1 hypothetical protein BHU72_02625 [Desulfuribacillus stibiiarsenatis]
MLRVGIPKAFLYHKYYPMWHTFFTKLGVEVVTSSNTTKEILKEGVMNTIDEACLPLKLYMGHILELSKMKVDYIFIPRFISVEQYRFLCPKFLGLPDLVKSSLREHDLPPILEPTINVRINKNDFYMEVLKLASKFNKSPITIYQAVSAAVDIHKKFKAAIHSGMDYSKALHHYSKGFPTLKSQEKRSDQSLSIAVIGHSYIIHDYQVSMNLIEKLEESGCTVKTTEMLTETQIDEATNHLQKDLFWSLNRELIGGAFHHLDHKNIDGLILVNAFSCGPDAITKELIERRYKRESDIPILSITVDEHTGEAGFITRLEAFIDMIKRKAKGGTVDESDISAHGQLLRRDESVV